MCAKSSWCAFIVCCNIVGMLVGGSAAADKSADIQSGFGFEMIMTKLKLIEDRTMPREEPKIERSCRAVPSSGIYTIQPEKPFKQPMSVLCDRDFEKVGWIVIQHRFDGSTNFYRNWQEYKSGFGNLEGEFWLGLDRIYQLTVSRPHELAVLLEDFEGNKTFAKYAQFEIGDEKQKYKITKLGEYSGTAGDSLGNVRGMPFSTFDADNDAWEGNCASELTGAWWYNTCPNGVPENKKIGSIALLLQQAKNNKLKNNKSQSNLNGMYYRLTSAENGSGMVWHTFRGQHYSLKSSKMMIRPWRF